MNALLCLAFFASGCASLLFETLWFRQTGLLLGNSVWASSLVTASFMGGLPELKWALTQTTLRTLPLWLMGSATRFAESEQHGSDAPYLRSWQALALCLAGAADEALEVVQRSRTAEDAATWNWIAGTCAESAAPNTL